MQRLFKMSNRLINPGFQKYWALITPEKIGENFNCSVPLETGYLNICMAAINTKGISQVHPELPKLVKGLLTCCDHFFQWSHGKYSERDGLSTEGCLGMSGTSSFRADHLLRAQQSHCSTETEKIPQQYTSQLAKEGQFVTKSLLCCVTQVCPSG